MAMGMGMGGPGGGMMRGFRKDRSVVEHKLGEGVVRRVLGYARPFRGLILVFLVLIVISAVLGVVPPLLFKDIIDRGVLGQDRQLIVILALVLAGVAIADAVLSLVQRWFSARIGEGLIYNLRTQVFDHVQSMPVSFFTRTQTGMLVSRLNNDVIGAQQAFTSTLSTAVSNIISLVLTLIAMISLSPLLTLAALVLVPIFLIPARIMGSKLADLTRRQMQGNADMSATMTERFSVSGALLVKLFGRKDYEHDSFAEKADSVRGVSVSIAMNQRFFMALMGLLAALATAMVYGVGGWFAVGGALSVGTLTALAGLLTRLYGPLTQLTNLRVDVMSALVSFERVFEILDLKPAIADKPDAKEASGIASVEFDNVTFSYPSGADASLASLEKISVGDRARPNEPVLNGISLSVEPGHTVALVGPSGGGKTTTTHLIARLYDVTGGVVRVGGDDVRDLKLASLQHQIGYVTQDAHMFHDTIRANLLYARPDATEDQMWQAMAAAQIDELVRGLPDGLDTVVGERGYRLSGGERQRLAISRLLLKAPPIVVLDEATAHLDSESEVAVQHALDTAMTGRTALVIAHRLSTVRNADQIVVLQHGRIVERGKHAELLARGGVYAELYRTQLGGTD
ncbi:ABC transporter ATP-binding protein [Granulicoccus phenolivorans]|uniref:ABC transporter ATP-binding protein n=1 Tax=Granulicoccus phenolivorans TaxID=266854 RepID=UPI0003FC8F92|nr:ABC transporter ATP-binding protein [Granulicoccus phenolivorans]